MFAHYLALFDGGTLINSGATEPNFWRQNYARDTYIGALHFGAKNCATH